jgi:hypothetical protein
VVDRDSSLSRGEQVLLKDYDSAVQLTYHVDGLRDRVTVFFVTVAGIAATGLTVVLKDSKASTLALNLSAALFLLVAALAAVVVLLLAKLRSAQLEHFRIQSNIRAYFYGSDVKLWKAAELSPSTVPKPTHRSGTYMWLAAILLVAAFSAALGAYLLVRVANHWMSNGLAWVVAAASGLVWTLLLDFSYFRLAKAREPHAYNEAEFETPGK